MMRRLMRFLVFLLFVILLTGSGELPSVAQVIPGLGLSKENIPSPSFVPVFTIGNLEIAPVFLDGKLMGAVTSFVDYKANNNDYKAEPYGASVRSQLMNSNLQKLLDNMTRYAQEVLPKQGIMGVVAQERELRGQLGTYVAQQQRTTVVTVAFPKNEVPELIFSVTQAEIARPRFGGSQPLLIAHRAARNIKSGLI